MGLMQLRGPAAEEMGLKFVGQGRERDERYVGAKSLQAGWGYYQKQLERFGTPRLALAAYVFGPGRVSEVLAASDNDPLVAFRNMPGEVVDYVNKVQRLAQQYGG